MSSYYQYNKFTNKKVKLLGVDLQELLFLMVGVIAMAIVLALLSSFGFRHWTLYVLVILIVGVSIYLLRKANKQNHPSFLFSLIAFRFLQPKKIKSLSPRNYSEQLERNREILSELKSKRQ